MDRYESSQKEIKKIIYEMSGKYSVYNIFADFITIAAITISNGVDKTQFDKREAKYFQIIEKYTKEDLDNFAKMLALTAIGLTHRMGDFIGELYMSLEFGNKHTGQYFTPYNISKMASKLVNDVEYVKSQDIIKFTEPSCGSGGMVIAYAENLKLNNINYQERLRVVCNDIDYDVVKMAYIQLSLLGIDAIVEQRNTLAPLNRPPGEYWITPMRIINAAKDKQRIEADEKLTKMHGAMKRLIALEKPIENKSNVEAVEDIIPGQMNIFDFV